MYDPLIRANARHRPHAVAVSGLQGDVSYGRFSAEIDCIAGAILDAGLRDVRLAVVAVADGYVNWLILLALNRLSVASATVGALGSSATVSLLKADLLITDLIDQASETKVLHVTSHWITTALKQSREPPSPIQSDPESLARVTLSSGTTGMPKMVGRTWAQIDRFVSGRCLMDRCTLTEETPQHRYLYLLGKDTVNYFVMLTTWAAGGTMLIGGSEMITNPELLRRLHPTMLSASPIQLQRLIAALPASFAPMPNLTIVSSGSHLPSSLAKLLRLRLTTNVWNFYASTEVSLIARGHVALMADVDGVVGWLEPGAQVDSVDDDDQPLPPGTTGVIRIRTTNMVTEYIESEEATAQYFKEGWFYPGDVGSVSSDGLMRIIGRAGEVMNIGGVKFLPRTLENAVLACRGVRDAAAFAMPNSFGLPTPWLAIVREEGLDEREIEGAIRALRLPPVHLGWVSEIPRNDRGKVQRDRLIAAAGAMPSVSSPLPQG